MANTRMKLRLTHRKTFPLRRVEEGHRDEMGRWQEGGVDPNFTKVKGNEQPFQGYEKEMLPESFRSKDLRRFFSVTFLRSVEEDKGFTPDEITIDGYQFEVQKRKSFKMGVQDHYEFLVVRKEQSAGGVS